MNYTSKKNWKSNQIAPDLPLFTILTETEFFKVPPKVISINRMDSLTMIRTEFYLANGTVHSIYMSAAQRINRDSIVFIPYFDYYTSKLSRSQIGPIQYFYDGKKYAISKNEANDLMKLNKKLSDLFQTKEIQFKYYIFKDTEERLKAEGYEYHYLAKKILKNSAHADLNNNSIIVGKYTSTYPHELVHLYTAKYYPKVHTWLDEGLSEYLGNNSKTLDCNRKILKKYFKSNSIITKDILSLDDNIAKNGTSLKYDFGSLLVEKIHKKYPKTWIQDIVNSGSDKKSFYDLIESKLNIKSDNLADSLLSWVN